MRFWLKILLVLVVALCALFFAAQLYQAKITALNLADIKSRASQVQPIQSLENLPPPVVRYLNHALPKDSSHLIFARYQQQGSLRTDLKKDIWLPFTASQIISPNSNEFLWLARVSLAPLLFVQVKDSLIRGSGAGQVSLFSAIPVASSGGNMEMNSGSLHRFLAEAVWCPSALLPSARLTWSPLDDFHAIATLNDGTSTVSLEFRFNSDNEITGIYTSHRWGSFDGGFKQVAWEGKFHNYQRKQGVLIPMEGEVGWYIDGQWQSVWRGSVVNVEMEFE